MMTKESWQAPTIAETTAVLGDKEWRQAYGKTCVLLDVMAAAEE